MSLVAQRPSKATVREDKAWWPPFTWCKWSQLPSLDTNSQHITVREGEASAVVGIDPRRVGLIVNERRSMHPCAVGEPLIHPRLQQTRQYL